MMKKGFVGSIVLAAAICISAIAPVLAAEYYITTFGQVQLMPITHVESGINYLTGGTHRTTVKFSNITVQGTYYLGFYQKLADNTYGGGTSQLAQATSLTMNRMYTFDLNANYHKEFITGKTAVGTISSVTVGN